MSPFEVNPSIAHAKTLSTDFYLDLRYFEESKEKIFSQSWQWVGDSDPVKEPGSVMPVTLLENFLDEPLLLSRDQQGTLHCLSNVCTHRGNLLIEKTGQVNDLRCKYHGRRFHLNGQFLSMPEFKEVENFPSPEDNLTSLSFFQWEKLLFASLHPAAPAEFFFREMKSRIGWMPLDQFVFRPDLSKSYEVNAHWALYCENYLEGFHIPFVHADLNAAVDYGNYTTELFRYGSLQLGLSKVGGACFDLPASSKDYGKSVAAYYFWIFPNMMFNFYPWGLSINIIRPLAPDKTHVSFLFYVWDESKLHQGAGADLHGVEMEDEDVVEHVQKGIRSRFYKHGRYSTTREQGTHHFHLLLAEFMNKGT